MYSILSWVISDGQSILIYLHTSSASIADEGADVGVRIKLVAEENLRRYVCLRATEGEVAGLFLVRQLCGQNRTRRLFLKKRTEPTASPDWECSSIIRYHMTCVSGREPRIHIAFEWLNAQFQLTYTINVQVDVMAGSILIADRITKKHSIKLKLVERATKETEGRGCGHILWTVIGRQLTLTRMIRKRQAQTHAMSARLPDAFRAAIIASGLRGNMSSPKRGIK